MTQKTLGYVELEWTCKRCGTKNPGMQKTCSNCGAPMAAEDKFELPDEQKLISDEDKLSSAQKGADIHCPYCGARNPAGSETCVQCGGDLKEGAARLTGKVLGAHQAIPVQEINCPYCASRIKADAQRCPNCGGDLTEKPQPPATIASAPRKLSPWALVGIGVLVLVCIGALAAAALLSARTKDVPAYVQEVSWQRSIDILEEQPLKKWDWEGSLPADAENISCEDKYRETSSQPAPKSTEACGTPYTIDQGSGAGKVVQDCQYLVYDSYCEFSVLEWQVISQPSAEGNDLSPYWPEVNLSSSQREGNRAERYVVRFNSDGRMFTYLVDDPALFAQFTPGSQWMLKVNAFGEINQIVP